MSIVKRQERKAREKEARKKEILGCAVIVFSQYGFVKTSMELVASEAALAVGTLYRYYKSKEELFVSIVFEAISTMYAGVDEIVKSSVPPEKKLELIWNYYYQFHEDNPMYYQALLFLHDPSFAKAFSDSASESVSRFITKNFKLLGRVVQEGVDKGVFYPDNPHGVADFLWSSFVGLVNLIETRRQFGNGASDLGHAHKAMWTKIRRAIVVDAGA